VLAVASFTTLHPMPQDIRQFAIFRIKKLHTKAEIGKAGNHNERRRKLPANVDPKRVEKNVSYVPDKRPLVDRVAEKLSKVKHRKDAVQAVEILCALSAGSEKFVPIESWAEASLEFIKKRFGAENLVSAVLHLDEKTPHLQAVIVPLMKDGKLAAKRLFGSRNLLRDLQTAYHDAVKQFGLQRGTKGSDREHISMRDFYQDQRSGMDILLEAIKTMPRKATLESWPAYLVKIKDHLLQSLSSLITAKTEAKIAREEAASLRRRVAELEDYAEAQEAALRSLPLPEVAEKMLGYSGKRKGKETVFADDMRHIVITGNRFRDQKSGDRGDTGAISLVRQIYRIDFDAAVDLLARHFPQASDIVSCEATRHASAKLKTFITHSAQQPVDLDAAIKFFAKPDSVKNAQLADALVKTGVAKDVIREVMAENLLWANPAGSICALRRTAKTLEFGVSISSQSSGAVQILGPHDAFFSLGRVRGAKRLCLVGSPVEALQLYTSARRPTVSLEGRRAPESIVSYLKAMGVGAVETSKPLSEALGHSLKEVGIDLHLRKTPQSAQKHATRERQISGPRMSR
jgi:hypothetical protein